MNLNVLKMKAKLLTVVMIGCLISLSSSISLAEQGEKLAEKQAPSRFLKRKVAIARFSNETQYAKGIFYNKENDPIGKQALDILSSKLGASNKFILLERNDFSKIEQEMKIGNANFQSVGADFIVIGSVTEFGRKNIGESKVFSHAVTQIVQAAVVLRLVDVSTGQVIYSEEAKGEAETKSKTVMGLGESADYDATLSDKAISAAISKLVENVINNCTNRPWKSYFLSYDTDAIIISGGKTQGIKEGDIFTVIEKGKTVKNPQTGLNIELPGKAIGKLKVESVGGESVESEYSIVSVSEGAVDKEKLSNYYIKQD